MFTWKRAAKTVCMCVQGNGAWSRVSNFVGVSDVSSSAEIFVENICMLLISNQSIFWNKVCAVTRYSWFGLASTK